MSSLREEDGSDLKRVIERNKREETNAGDGNIRRRTKEINLEKGLTIESKNKRNGRPDYIRKVKMNSNRLGMWNVQEIHEERSSYKLKEATKYKKVLIAF